MRKKGLKVLFLMMALALIIVGCGTKENAKEENAKKESSKNESSEVTTGASEGSSYTPLAELKDSYDIVIVGSGGLWNVSST